MPNIKDMVEGYGEQHPTYDGPYLDGHDYDPVKELNGPPVELAPGEETFNMKGQLIKAPEAEEE